MKKGKKAAAVRMSDTENHQGLFENNDEAFKFLVSSKAAQTLEKKAHKIKPSKIDAFLTRLYLAL